MLKINIPYLSKFIIGLLLLVCFTVKTVQGNEGPTLLKKSDKKEKLREEDLVTKEVDRLKGERGKVLMRKYSMLFSDSVLIKVGLKKQKKK